MWFSSTIKAALLGSLVAVPSVVRAEVAADPNCWRADEVTAARFEDFRLKMLVGALNCKNYLPGAAASYNVFLQTKKEFVLANMYVVRAHFARETGASEGADQFADYETLAGNRHSAPTFDRAKCETVDAYARLATTMSDGDLVKLLDVVSPGPPPSGCKVAPRPVVVVATVAAAPPAPVVAVTAAPLAATAPAAVSAAPVAATPVLTPAVMTAPSAPPLTDARRVAAATAATRLLLASRAQARPAEVQATMADASGEATPVAAPAVPIAEVKPVAVAAPAAAVAAPAPVVPAPAVAPVGAPASIPPGAAQALADAARALAAAAAAMQPAAR